MSEKANKDMSALHPQILDPELWRPASWYAEWSVTETDAGHKHNVKNKWVTKAGVLVERKEDKNGRVLVKGCPDGQRKDVERIAHNSRLLRDCWITPAIVWQVVELFFGQSIACDPWWNPWSALSPAVRLDGSLGCDGFAVDKDGKPKYWRGPVGANGPHSATTHTPEVPDDSDEEYRKGGWLRMCSEYGQTEQCAAVLPARGDRHLYKYGMTADIVIEFGRLNFDPPPGINGSSNPGCTLVALWLPNRDCSTPARKLFNCKTGFRCEIPTATKNKDTGRLAREILVRHGVPAYSPKSDPLRLVAASS